MSDYIPFPEEILMEILKRLSIDDAVRCTNVCKSWYSLLTSHSFICLHSQHQIASTNNHKGLVLVRDNHSERDFFSLHIDDEPFREYRRLHFPFTSSSGDSYFRVVGCVNGVVCLSDDTFSYTEVMYLWNPSIRKFIDLPTPIFSYGTHGGFDHCIGFGFDDGTNDFKVVRVVNLYDRGPIFLPKVEIYEPKVGSWREVDSKGFSHFIDVGSPQVFLNGNVHWFIGCKIDYVSLPNNKNLIVSFDLTTEVFGEMKAPECLNEHKFRQDVCLSEYEGSLSLIHYSSTEHVNSSCIWVMKQYGVADSWTKLFCVDAAGYVFRVFGFRRNGEALVKGASKYYANGEYVISCEPRSKQMKILVPFEAWKPLYVDNFVETLALLGVKGDSLLDDKSDGKGSPDKDSYETEDERRSIDPGNLFGTDYMPPVHVQVTWFGLTD